MDERRPDGPDGPDDARPADAEPQGAPAGALDSLRAALGPRVDPQVDLESDDTDPQPADSTPSSARYDVFGEVARGGMGRILRVRDRDLRRSLAMKVLLAGGAAADVDAAVVNRFLEEAQVTAQLNHPGVVPVHELGVDPDGQVFFTMSLVRGSTLSEVFRLARSGAPGWTMSRVLQVMLRVCETIAFAHSKGVVHRDLKPSNVMVGRYGAVYVMDWGLAKVRGHGPGHDIRLRELSTTSVSRVRTVRSESEDVDSPLMTMDGAVVGTPAYMPPEQAEGRVDEVDPQSDVYAIGAMLYELLTGQPPYVRADERISPRMILARIHVGPPEPISTLAEDAPPELVAIAEKAMARDKRQRYEDAKDLEDDVQRFLSGHVVRAYRTGAVIEFRKWVARNRAVAATVVAAVVLIAVATGAFVMRLDRERERAEAQGRIAREQREIADANAADAERQRARADLERRQAEEQEAMARDAHRRAEELTTFLMTDLRDRLRNLNRLEIMDPVIARALAYYDEVPADANDAAGLLARARAHVAVAELLNERRRYADAKAPARTAVDLVAPLHDDAPEMPGLRITLAEARVQLAGAIGALGDRREELTQLRAALDLAETHLQADSGDARARSMQVMLLGRISHVLGTMGDTTGYEAGHARHVAELRKLGAAHPDDLSFPSRRIRAELNFAKDRLTDGARRQALDRLRGEAAELSAKNPGNPWLTALHADTLAALAGSHWGDQDGDRVTGLEHALAARALYEELLAENPDKLGYRQSRLRVMLTESRCRTTVAHFDGAIEAARGCVDAARTFVADDPANLEWRGQLGECLDQLAYSLGRYRARQVDALPHAREARKVYEDIVRRTGGEASAISRLADAHGRESGLLYSLGRLDESLAAAESGLRLTRALASRTPPPHGWQHAELQLHGLAAKTRIGRSEFTEAVGHRRRALELHEELYGASEENRAQIWLRMVLRQAEMLARSREPESPLDHAYLAQALFEIERWNAATFHFERALVDAKIRSNFGQRYRYRGACAAAQASVEEAVPEQAAALRALALRWLAEDVREMRAILRRTGDTLRDPESALQQERAEATMKNLAGLVRWSRNGDTLLDPIRGTPEFEAIYEEPADDE